MNFLVVCIFGFLMQNPSSGAVTGANASPASVPLSTVTSPLLLMPNNPVVLASGTPLILQ